MTIPLKHTMNNVQYILYILYICLIINNNNNKKVKIVHYNYRYTVCFDKHTPPYPSM